jgi:hypothetical protein
LGKAKNGVVAKSIEQSNAPSQNFADGAASSEADELKLLEESLRAKLTKLVEDGLVKDFEIRILDGKVIAHVYPASEEFVGEIFLAFNDSSDLEIEKSEVHII